MPLNIQHVRVAIVDPNTGMPTKAFYDLLCQLGIGAEDAEIYTDTIYQTSQFTAQEFAAGEFSNTLSAHEMLMFSLPDAASEVANLEKLIKPNVRPVGPAVTAFTTSGNQILLCDNFYELTITLNPAPYDGEQVIIKRRRNKIYLDGTIDGRDDWEMPTPYEALRLIYTTSAGEWSVL